MYVITFLPINPFYKLQLISDEKNTFKQPQRTSNESQTDGITLLLMEILTWESRQMSS